MGSPDPAQPTQPTQQQSPLGQPLRVAGPQVSASTSGGGQPEVPSSQIAPSVGGGNAVVGTLTGSGKPPLLNITQPGAMLSGTTTEPIPPLPPSGGNARTMQPVSETPLVQAPKAPGTGIASSMPIRSAPPQGGHRSNSGHYSSRQSAAIENEILAIILVAVLALVFVTLIILMLDRRVEFENLLFDLPALILNFTLLVVLLLTVLACIAGMMIWRRLLGLRLLQSTIEEPYYAPNPPMTHPKDGSEHEQARTSPLPVHDVEVPVARPFVQMEPARFQDVAPTDKSDPVESVDERGEAAHDKWVVVGSSQRGRSHMHDGKYREDSWQYALLPRWQIVAVSDGGGAYSLARVGAKIAAQSAVAAMRNVLESEAATYSKFLPWRQPPPINTDEARMAIVEGFKAAYAELQSEAQKRNAASGRQDAWKELRTTLLLVAHHQRDKDTHLFVGGQIGDGLIMVRDMNGQFHQIGTPDTGPSGNEVVFLQDVSPDEWDTRARVLELPNAAYCLAMTDGISDDFLPVETYLERLERPMLRETLASKEPKDAAVALTTLLNYERDASFDDRTLVAIYKPGSYPWK